MPTFGWTPLANEGHDLMLGLAQARPGGPSFIALNGRGGWLLSMKRAGVPVAFMDSDGRWSPMAAGGEPRVLATFLEVEMAVAAALRCVAGRRGP